MSVLDTLGSRRHADLILVMPSEMLLQSNRFV
jgi:hypothetical protein